MWMVATGCGQDDGPAQGPANASFEVAGDSSACGTAGIPSAAGWIPFCTEVGAFGPYPTRRDGTGFVPTDGSYFVALPGKTLTTSSTVGIRQDVVDLSETTTLRFDYEAIGMVGQGSVSAGTATVEILFTSAGTTSLWSKSFPVGAIAEQVRDATAMVGVLPAAGRLTIQVLVTGANSGLAAPPPTELEFRIDNLRAE